MADLRMIFGQYRRDQRDAALRAERAQIINDALNAPQEFASDGSGMGPPTPGGLLADPTNLQNQLRFAGALEGAPGGGGGLLNQLITGQQQRSTVGDQLFQRERESQRMAEVAGLDREQRSETTALNAYLELQRQAEQRRQFDTSTQLQIGQMFGGAPGGAAAAKPETGTYVTQTPRGPEMIPVIGSKQWTAGAKELESRFNLRQNFAEISNMIETNAGRFPELGSPDRSALDSRVFLAQMAVKELAGLGVLSDDERNELKELLPDPGKTVRWSKALQQRYGVFLDLLETQLEDTRWRTQYWQGLERYQDEQLQ